MDNGIFEARNMWIYAGQPSDLSSTQCLQYQRGLAIVTQIRCESCLDDWLFIVLPMSLSHFCGTSTSDGWHAVCNVPIGIITNHPPNTEEPTMFSMPFPRRSPWSSFQDMERILDEMNRAFSLVREEDDALVTPPVNIWSGSDGLAVTAEIPGVAPESIQVSVLDNTLTIRGNRPAGNGEQNSSEEFSRSVQLPYRVASDHTEAHCRNGILLVVLPRPEAEKPRRIAVKAA
jgi:HSP20 family protein